MIDINFDNYTYTCPYCGHEQAYTQDSHGNTHIGFNSGLLSRGATLTADARKDIFKIHWFKCSNKKCLKVCITAINALDGKQIDIMPKVTIKHFPDYIPQQIRNDYEEASTIIDDSPKAAATLFRRCLQGMIHDFWGIKEKNLNAEISSLQGKVPVTQWKAIDSLRQIGNIGAHMEKDVNVIVDIDVNEAKTLQKLIELLIEKWYKNRYDEEQLYASITHTADEKKEQRKNESDN
jgi:hypothetical protein